MSLWTGTGLSSLCTGSLIASNRKLLPLSLQGRCVLERIIAVEGSDKMRYLSLGPRATLMLLCMHNYRDYRDVRRVD